MRASSPAENPAYLGPWRFNREFWTRDKCYWRCCGRIYTDTQWHRMYMSVSVCQCPHLSLCVLGLCMSLCLCVWGVCITMCICVVSVYDVHICMWDIYDYGFWSMYVTLCMFVCLSMQMCMYGWPHDTFMYEYFACMYVPEPHSCLVSLKVSRGLWIPQDWS